MVKFVLLGCFIFTLTFNLVDSIFGGEEGNINQFPYQVSVRLNDAHVCGGSIIDKTTIVTAAHCVQGKDYYAFSISVGDTYHKKGQIYPVMDVIEHPLYSRIVKYDFDIALLKLHTNLKFSSNVQSIALQQRYKEVPPNTVSWVSGWGKTEGYHVSKKLKAVKTIIISNDDCYPIYESVLKISNRMLCAHTFQCQASMDAHSCKGDSGGPLVFNNTLIGVVSWGLDCIYPEFPGVYTKVSAVHDWIMKNKDKRPHFCSKL